MSTPSLGIFLLSLIKFSALGAIFGIVYRALWSALTCIRSVPTCLALCAVDGKIAPPRKLLLMSQREKSMAGKIFTETLNFFIIIIFGIIFLGVWYILTDAVPRVIFPVLCIAFFLLSDKLFGSTLKRVGILLAFIISLIPSVPVLIFSKITKKYSKDIKQG